VTRGSQKVYFGIKNTCVLTFRQMADTVPPSQSIIEDELVAEPYYDWNEHDRLEIKRKLDRKRERSNRSTRKRDRPGKFN